MLKNDGLKMTPKIDGLDQEITHELMRDSRKSFRDIARKLGVAEGTIYNRVNKLREGGVIKGFVLDLDYSKMGYDLTVLIGATLKGERDALVEALHKEPNITAIYDVTGEYDAIIVARFRDPSEVNAFIKRLHEVSVVKRTNTMLVLDILKEDQWIEPTTS